MGSAPHAPPNADDSSDVTLSSATQQSSSMSQVLPKIPGTPRVPAEALALAEAAEPRGAEARPSSGSETLGHDSSDPARSRHSNHPSLPPALARVGRYDVLGRIAVGGMAEIFLGREHVETGALRHVAIKVLRLGGSATADDTYFEELFMREGRTAAQLVHPNICHVYEFGKSAGYFYIAMEWIEGASLRHVLAKLLKRQKTMPPNLAVGIAAQVAGALHYAHNVRDARRRPLEVVHLDVNPQNIMLRHDGVVKLLDFGIAQVADPRGDSRSDVVKGKIGYIAPEQARQQTLDRRVDVFGLGTCLFEMLTGKAAYRRESMRESLEALLTLPVPSLRDYVPELPTELDEIVQKALAREPGERFQTAGELQAALEGYLARSREVVSGRHIAQLMESITPSKALDGPSLYTGPEVASRLTRPPDDLLDNVEFEPLRKRALRPRKKLLVACIGVVLGAFGAYLLTEATSAPVATKPAPAIAAPAAIAPERPAEARELTPQDSLAAPVEAASAERSRATPPPAVTKGKRANRRRIKPGFVADPGF
jgi:serine/threonine-protein kinase